MNLADRVVDDLHPILSGGESGLMGLGGFLLSGFDRGVVGPHPREIVRCRIEDFDLLVLGVCLSGVGVGGILSDRSGLESGACEEDQEC